MFDVVGFFLQEQGYSTANFKDLRNDAENEATR